ncbi:5-oxoprolinase subunit B family protein [Dietzia cinnamea]|uniref:5-oxoprolinase subunit B family protein n=1 Tax=Dietzia cinnamea TaxID=321318 RepID=UPI00223AA94E|nr:allophanate hydrolase subunit 1 [Dietzia cinnamea]MCT2174986.1 allophanate hydrolase subunit 1 [Dietzia cinnamea]
MTTTRIRSCGEAALLLECAGLAEAVQLAGRVRGLRPEAVDVVAAARTVLVTAREASALPGLRRRVEALLSEESPPTQNPLPTPHPPPTPNPPSTQNPLPGARIRYPYAGSGSGGGVADPGDAGAAEVILDVRYDGPDLHAVADLAGLSTEAFVRTHTAIAWRAAFGGFAPGFAYLVDARELDARGRDARGPDARDREQRGPGGPRPLPTVPRLPSPRARVPAGSVGLADRFCAVYPGASPGGWQLIGTTDARLWDVDRPDPALLTPGTIVRFRDAGGSRGCGGPGADR